MSTPTFEPTAFIDLTREQILSVLNGGAPPAGAHPLSAAEFNRIGAALQVMSQNLAALQGTAQTASQVQAAVQAAVTTLIGGAPAALDTFVELANALGNDPNKISALSTQITGKYTKPSGGIPAADLAESYSVVLPTAGATLTADTTLTANTAVQVDATTGNVTLTLPAITRVGQRVRVRRLDGTTNTVAVTGIINGVTGTVNMPFLLEIRTFVAESLTTWSVESGNTPKTALDAAYGQVWRPNTAYAQDALVLSPEGRIVKRKAAGTSGSTYDPAAWDVIGDSYYVQRATSGELGYADVSTGIDTTTVDAFGGSPVPIAGLTISFTLTEVTRVDLTMYAPSVRNATAGNGVGFVVKDGIGTEVARTFVKSGTANQDVAIQLRRRLTLPAGTHTFSGFWGRWIGGTASINSGVSTAPTFLSATAV